MKLDSKKATILNNNASVPEGVTVLDSQQYGKRAGRRHSADHNISSQRHYTDQKRTNSNTVEAHVPRGVDAHVLPDHCHSHWNLLQNYEFYVLPTVTVSETVSLMVEIFTSKIGPTDGLPSPSYRTCFDFEHDAVWRPGPEVGSFWTYLLTSELGDDTYIIRKMMNNATI